MENNMRPCPFCGVQPIEKEQNLYLVEHNNYCYLWRRTSGLVSHFFHWLKGEQEIEGWNKRID